MTTPWFRPHGTGLRVTIKARPGCRKPLPPALAPQAGGGHALQVAVAEAAVDGKANAAILDRLAEWWGLPASRLRILVGGTGRLKVVEINGPPAVLMAEMEAWATRNGLG